MLLAAIVFSATSVAVCLISDRLRRTALSELVLFLASGLLCGPMVLAAADLDPRDPAVRGLALGALVVVLFSDGLQLGWPAIAEVRSSAGRALLVGLPLTAAGIALLAHLLLALGWPEALVLGAICSPTDPVLSAAIIGRTDVPQGLRHLLGVESGVNDGLALPLVAVTLAFAGAESRPVAILGVEVLAGAAIGLAVPSLLAELERLSWFAVRAERRPIVLIASGALAVGLSASIDANELLAAFCAGLATHRRFPDAPEDLGPVLETAGFVAKNLAVFALGALVTGDLLLRGWRPWAFCALALVIARPLAIRVALGRALPPRQLVAVAWFGPRGFATLAFAALALHELPRGGPAIFDAAALLVVSSLVAHGSTDVIAARWLARGAGAGRSPR